MATDIQKRLNSSESYVSLALGVGVVLMIGTLLYNYATRGNNQPVGDAAKTEVTKDESQPTKHTVAAGETLWSVSEKYYKTGYNWTDIQAANNLANADDVKEGMELVIPVVTPIMEENTQVSTATGTTGPTGDTAGTEEKKAEPTATSTTAPTVTPTVADTLAPTVEAKKVEAPTTATPGEKGATSGKTYTVKEGDTLWQIAADQLKDSYKWSEVAQMNNLTNPDLLYVGTVLQLP